MLGERVESWSRRHVPLVDTATASAIAALCLLFGWFVRADFGYFALSLMLLLPLAFRRRRPVVSAALVMASAFVQWLTVRDGIGALPADVAVPMAVFAVTAYGPPWAGRLALVAGLLGAVLGGWSWPQLEVPVSAHVFAGACLASPVLVAWAFGVLRAVRLEQVDALSERARMLETERDQRARLAVLAERGRIAREMHDVVAHSLAVITAQADGGRYAAASTPDAAVAALATISGTGRQALVEMRRVLGVLREDPDDVGEGSALPQPGFPDLARLVDRVRAGGLDVALRLDTAAAPVEPGLGLAAYRIVQEGLTNVIKHAGPGARAEVSVRCSPENVEIEVLDDGRGASPAADASGHGAVGHGLIGMRERVAACGGTLWFGARPGGGQAVRARIPVVP